MIHHNQRTLYQGVDEKIGYLYKFVANESKDLSSGILYVYKGSKEGSGNWIKLKNDTKEEQNTILDQSAAVEATVFDGVEDVEISPLNGMVYLAVKREEKVYRFEDSDPIDGVTVTNFETFVGGMDYEINNDNSSELEPWGKGNDNLAFDDKGNLWVLQDGDNNFIWVVGIEHTQEFPKVRIFGKTPLESEPTGITFTPDFKYLFMSIQHPDASNSATSQLDAFNLPRTFDNDVTIVITIKENLNNNITLIENQEGNKLSFNFYPNPSKGQLTILSDQFNSVEKVYLLNLSGQKVIFSTQLIDNGIELGFSEIPNGIYMIYIILESGEKLLKKIMVSNDF